MFEGLLCQMQFFGIVILTEKIRIAYMKALISEIIRNNDRSMQRTVGFEACISNRNVTESF